MGNWNDAISLICPKCNAMNRPKATVIELDRNVATCGVCGHSFQPERRFAFRPPWMWLLLFALGASSASAQIPVDQLQIFASPDVRAWPVTTQITHLEFTPAGVRVAFTKQDGPERWPDVIPPGWQGPLQFTLWLVVNVNGQWCASGIIEYWHGLDAAGGDVLVDNQIARNWVYDGRWGPMAGHQPAAGERVGFFITAGDQRGKDAHQVAERSDVIEIEWPATTGTPRVVWTEGAAPPQLPTVPPPAPPVVVAPVPQPVLASTDLSPVLNQMAVEAMQRAEQFRALEAYIDARTAEIRGDIKSVKDAVSGAVQFILKYIAPIAGPIIAAIMARKGA